MDIDFKNELIRKSDAHHYPPFTTMQAESVPLSFDNTACSNDEVLAEASNKNMEISELINFRQYIAEPEPSLGEFASLTSRHRSRSPIPEEYKQYVTQKQHENPATWWALESVMDHSALYSETENPIDVAAMPSNDLECRVVENGVRHCWECCECQIRFRYPIAKINMLLPYDRVMYCRLDGCKHERCGFCLGYNAVFYEVFYSDGSHTKGYKREERG